MSKLGRVVEAVEKYNQFVLDEVKRARTDKKFGRQMLDRWNGIKANTPIGTAPTGLKLPRLALPEIDEPGEIARYLLGDGMPGEFPYLNGAYREMYLEPLQAVPIEIGSFEKNGGKNAKNGQSKNGKNGIAKLAETEEPTRLFAGLGLAEDTNARFHYLGAHQRSNRLSTAFDGPTLYGLDSDADGVFGKVGEGGVAIDTVEDMERLYAGFDLGAPSFSVSMTINGPAPIILAMYVAAAKRRFGTAVVPKLRGTIQADMLKEVQAQNEIIFPVEASLRFLGDMVEYTTREHAALVSDLDQRLPHRRSRRDARPAGRLHAVERLHLRRDVPRAAFRWMTSARGSRSFSIAGWTSNTSCWRASAARIWAIGMRDVFGAGAKAQLFKLHTQTSGRSLIAHEFKNNLTRTAVELMLAYMNATNSCHSNSADEPFTTPSEEYVRLAAHAQAILLEESGLFKHTMNMLTGSPGMKAVERAVEEAILAEFREIDGLGGVLSAIEHRYQRSQIQHAAHRYEQQIYDGTRPIIGLNKYRNVHEEMPKIELVRTPRAKKQLQVDRLKQFKKKNAAKAAKALEKLAAIAETNENCFPALLEAAEVCSLGQISGCLQEVVGRFRPMV